MTTFHFAFDALTSCRNRFSCALPRKVLFGLLIASLHCWETGWLSEGMRKANRARVAGGAVGARSGWPVWGLSQTPFADAFALRNERSSRKNTCRFLPQRKVR